MERYLWVYTPGSIQCITIEWKDKSIEEAMWWLNDIRHDYGYCAHEIRLRKPSLIDIIQWTLYYPIACLAIKIGKLLSYRRPSSFD